MTSHDAYDRRLSALDGGDVAFTMLLRQIAQMYRSNITELQVLRKENDQFRRHTGNPLHTPPGSVRTSSARPSSAGPLPRNHHYNSSPAIFNRDSLVSVPKPVDEESPRIGIPLPAGDPCPLPGVLREDDENSTSVHACGEVHGSYGEHGSCGEPPNLSPPIAHRASDDSHLTAEKAIKGHARRSTFDECSQLSVTFQEHVEGDREPLTLWIMREVWVSSKQSMDLKKMGTGVITLRGSNNNVEELSHSMRELKPEQAATGDLVNDYSGFLRPIILFPASPKRIAWDLAGAVLIFWDLTIIPLNLSTLTPDESTFLDVMDWLTLLFWTANMFSTLLVGFVKDGMTEMNPMKILIHYLKTWFVLDLMVVLPDWFFTMTKAAGDSDDSEGGDSVRLLRILRLARCVRLLRLAKLKAVFSLVNDLINSEYTNIILNIVKMIVALVAINHWIGCMWFLTAESQTDVATWISFHGFSDSDAIYQYLTAFHWAITQFTPSSMHVQPQNTPERAFTVIIIVFGLVGFSYLVGSITGSLTELRQMNADTSKLFWNLRRYLKQQKVPTELSVRIQKFLEHKWQSLKMSVSQESVTVLKHLSEQLNNELQRVISVPHMVVHPLFRHLNSESSVTMQRLATSAISRKQLASGDSLFFPLEKATDMSFVVDGRLQYIRMRDDEKEWVDKDEDWISEPCLWTDQWHHQGELIAVRPCELLMINPLGFADIIKRNPQVHAFVNGYAVHFIKWLNGIETNNLSDITQGEDSEKQIKDLMMGRMSVARKSLTPKRLSKASLDAVEKSASAKMVRPDFFNVFGSEASTR